MRLLLDSHTLLWFANGELAPRTRAWIESTESDVYVSVVTPYELGLKHAKGRLGALADLGAVAGYAGFGILNITWTHAETAAALPRIHGDPWDRMLVAQAQVEGLSLVTDDEEIARYAVHTVPAR